MTLITPKQITINEVSTEVFSAEWKIWFWFCSQCWAEDYQCWCTIQWNVWIACANHMKERSLIINE